MTIQNLTQKLNENPAIAAELVDAPADQQEAILQKHFPEVSHEEWKTMLSAPKNGELSEDSLESVSGGFAITAVLGVISAVVGIGGTVVKAASTGNSRRGG